MKDQINGWMVASLDGWLVRSLVCLALLVTLAERRVDSFLLKLQFYVFDDQVYQFFFFFGNLFSLLYLCLLSTVLCSFEVLL